MRSPLLPIFLIVLVDVLGLTIILPLLPFYAEHFGATPHQVGWLTATFAFFQLFSGPALGAISDRVGRKPLLIVSQIGTLIGFAILAGAQSLTTVFISRAIDGATAGNLSLAQAYIADVTEPKDRAKAFALIGIAFGIGFLIGPAISGILAHHNYRDPIYVAMFLSFLSIVATIVLLPTVRPAENQNAGPAGRRLGAWQWGRYPAYFRREGLGAALLLSFLFFLSFSMFTAGFAMFAERRFTWEGRPFGPREVGFAFGWAGLLGIFIQGGLVGRLVKRMGEARLARSGFATASASYAVLAASNSLSGLFTSSTLSSFGNGVLRPALTSLVSKKAGPEEQGIVLGLSQSLNAIATIIAPIAGGWLIEQGWLGTWSLTAGALCALGLLLSSRL